MFLILHAYIGMDISQATKDHATSDLSKPDYLYGLQVIDVIMRKSGKITIITDLS